MFRVNDNSDDVLGLWFSSQLAAAGSRCPCPGICQQKSAATGAAAGSAVVAASIGKLLEMPKEDVALHCLSNQLWKVQTGRNHTNSSTKTSSQSALSDSAGQNSRQVLFEHHEEIFGKPHKNTWTCAVDGFDFAEKMPRARRPVTATLRFRPELTL